MVNSERDRLWFFLLSARVFPFTPHWLLNIASPFLDVPLRYHTSSVFISKTSEIDLTSASTVPARTHRRLYGKSPVIRFG
uniref:Secreted protein n=1 Tax=Caenorhabditis tropicalis TaxID=1561998 RepID=A0A1I7T6W8_9PELO